MVTTSSTRKPAGCRVADLAKAAWRSRPIFKPPLSAFSTQRNRFTTVNFLARILITSGPTRQFIDPVRYLTNASSGRMGKALAEAALALGHDVVIVSGPV